MAIRTVSDCNNCADCIGCGRNRKRRSYVCDICGAEIDGSVYDLNGKEVCEVCFLETGYLGEAEWLLDEEMWF